MIGSRRARIALGITAALLLLAAALVLRTFSAAPLPLPPPYAGPVPSASPPAEMAVFQLPTGITHRTAAFAYRGGSFRDGRDFAMTAVLVRHPRGDVLVDGGFGRDIAAHIGLMPLPFRLATRYERFRSADEQLRGGGYDPKNLRAIVLTHAHWDHASGAADLPHTPIWVTAEEHRFIAEGGALTAVARTLPDARFEEYGFEDGPYLGFPASHDVYDDGAIVIVPAPGHTPGSVIVFVTLPSGARHALVGDLVWQREGISEREERPWLMRTVADRDPEGVRASVLRMSALAQRFPDLNVVPAHDARGFEPIPRWTGAR